ncbi:MAG: ABC transporter permease, partial [Clostridia bacterium]|nr:ABC transporter permease [Clostridia bacterium]
ELAERYATRTVRLLDGKIIDDTDPYQAPETPVVAKKKEKRAKKPSMSFFTALSLSLNNLLTKKARTLLTSFAGSIGIIGIALIYAVSQGMTTYINAVQEDTLSSYPLTIKATNIDINTLMETFMGVASNAKPDHDLDAVYSQSVMFDMINALNNLEETDNDLASFKKFIDAELKKQAEEASPLRDSLSGVQYTYNMDLLVYTENVDGKIIQSDTRKLLSEALSEHFGMSMMGMMGGASAMGSMSGMGSMPMMGGGIGLWCEILSGKDGSLISPVVENQYDLVYGSWPNQANEIVLVLNENNELDDLTLYALGLESKEEIDAVFEAVLDKEDIKTERKSWSYEEICAMEFRVIFNSDCYTKDENTGLFTDRRETEAGLRYLYDNAYELKVVGIIRPNEDASATMLTGSIAYTKALTEYVIEHSKDSAAILAQLADSSTDIFTGLPFSETTGSLSDQQKEAEFRAYVEGLTAAQKADAYVKIMSTPSAAQLETAVNQAMASMDRAAMEESLVQVMIAQMGMSESEVRSYITSMKDDDLTTLVRQMVTEQVKMQYAAAVRQQLASMTSEQMVMALTMALPNYTTEQCALYYDEVMEFSKSSYDNNLQILGYVDLEDPYTVNLFASSFENKDVIEEVIAQYNEGVEDLSKIRYTDYIGLMMSSITTIINAITYVLIAFVAISLVVSSIMIGVITLISVQERTKEIGILRAIGASKRNVSGMFNAETMIIGFASGLLGVIITYLLCIPINFVINTLTGIPSLDAYLPLPTAVILVVISVLLTLISGIIPSRSAAKKDPVVALRTE